jgi:nitrate/nitrite transport system ATP-binding protein
VDSVYENRMLRREKAELTTEYLRRVGLWEHRGKRPDHLSGGMKQRAAIARAFAVHPKVLLLDEPFGALDALTRSSLQDQLLDLWGRDSGIETVVMVTHDIDEAIYLSDRIVVMTNGPAATVGEVLAVPVERPREKRAMLHRPEVAALKERLLYLLMVVYGEKEAAA